MPSTNYVAQLIFNWSVGLVKQILCLFVRQIYFFKCIYLYSSIYDSKSSMNGFLYLILIDTATDNVWYLACIIH